ncbi:hypothetical protein R1sor_006459 [Riccia sorocarpa]|uniref:Uncharacterized protein n=1 Tax=Riccia sorocarpa TaxID=122646 RepID=A0ABD3HMH3_9MARC
MNEYDYMSVGEWNEETAEEIESEEQTIEERTCGWRELNGLRWFSKIPAVPQPIVVNWNRINQETETTLLHQWKASAAATMKKRPRLSLEGMYILLTYCIVYRIVYRHGRLRTKVKKKAKSENQRRRVSVLGGEKYEEALTVLEEQYTNGKEAAEYIRAIDAGKYAHYALKLSRYGRVTSNAVECMNAAFLKLRVYVAKRLIFELWTYMMHCFYER